jgi:hypothetical protein
LEPLHTLSIIANAKHSFKQRKEIANAKLAIEVLNVANTQVKNILWEINYEIEGKDQLEEVG